ncbi:mannosyltransferase family protein [Streptomyces sp. SCSIO 30461]|uniref:mannosyltransferase family protein n=1 Tax=Streptomyces sp. SCSIO 30461 TaxID=3118085 RepID=UPI0030D3AC7E
MSQHPRFLLARLRSAPAAPALLGYAAVRLIGMVVLAIAAAATGKDGLHRLKGRWDAVWYVRIAENGYGYEVTLPDHSVHSDLAFFPLLPALERGVSEALPFLDAATAGLVIAWVAAFGAAWGIYAVGAQVAGHRAGVLLAVLWGVYPTAFVQSMAYTETVFTAFAAWSLYALLNGRWITAGALCAFAGLTRPSAAALVMAIGITALVCLVRGGFGSLTWRMAAGVVLASLGWLGYVVFVAVREGSPTAYFEVQAAWGNNIDGGAALARFVGKQLTGAAPLAGVGLIAALGLLGWLVWLCVRQRQPLPVLVYAIGIVVISLIGAAYFGSRPRLIMPAFPMLLPPAAALARIRPRWSTTVLGVLAVASGVCGAFTLLGSGPP